MGFVGSLVAQSFFSAMGGFGEGADADTLAANDDQSELAEGDDSFDADGDLGDFDV